MYVTYKVQRSIGGAVWNFSDHGTGALATKLDRRNPKPNPDPNPNPKPNLDTNANPNPSLTPTLTRILTLTLTPSLAVILTPTVRNLSHLGHLGAGGRPHGMQD